MKQERLNELGFHVHVIKKETPMLGKVIFRKKGFSHGWELTLPYTTHHGSFLGNDIQLTSTLYKVTGDQRELLVQVKGDLSDAAMEEIITNAIRE
jgi:hypothetical protein